MLDRIWALNPRAYMRLAPLGPRAGIPLLIVAFALATAGSDGSSAAAGDGGWRWRSSLPRFSAISSIFLRDGCLKAASVSPQPELSCSIS